VVTVCQTLSTRLVLVHQFTTLTFAGTIILTLQRQATTTGATTTRLATTTTSLQIHNDNADQLLH